jgi:Uma2 family endonuclease
MASPAPSFFPATERDLYSLPEDVIGQIIDGELIVHPRPDPPHTQAASVLGLLTGPFWQGFGSGPGGWGILDEPKIRFPPDLLVPDLAGWKQERFVPLRKGPYLVVPDWICEILSPSTARDDRVRKLPIHARHGVRHAWVIDPRLRTLEVLRLHEGSWLIASTHHKEERVRAEPFDAVEIDLSLLWLDLPAEEEEDEESS